MRSLTALVSGLALVTALLATDRPAWAQDEDGENGGVVGLTLPIGTRVIGQGRAAAGVLGDLHAVPYNPASQHGFERGAITFSRFESADLTDINSNYVAAAYAGPWGSIGGHFTFLDFGSIPVTDASPTPITTIDLSEVVLGVTYANQWQDRLAYGVTGKWYRSDLGVVEASGPAFDIGVVYAPRPEVPVQFGASVRNIGPDLEFEDGDVAVPGGGAADDDRKENLPTRIRVGIRVALDEAFDLPPQYVADLLFDVESDAREFSTSSQHFGGSVGFNGVVVLRGGVVVVDNPFVDNGDGSRQIGGAFGVGIRYEGFEADISREVSVSELGDETHFAVGWRF